MSRRDAYNRRNREGWQPSERQREVLDLLAEGKSNAEIAVRLDITVDGAKWHVGELLAETGYEDRQALAAWWRRERGRKPGLFGVLSLRLAGGAAAAVVAAALLALAVALTGDSPSPTAPEAAQAPEPTPWPEEALEALAASQGPAPATCEPPEAQDLRIVTAAELQSQGLEPAGRVIVADHCPLYVANRLDRAVVWAGGGGLLRFEPWPERRLTSAHPCCASALLTLNGAGYQLSASGWTSDSTRLGEFFSEIDRALARIVHTRSDGAYLIMTLREWTSAPVRLRHRVAFASDGQMFVDPASLSGDIVANGLTGEAIDVSEFGPGMLLRVEVATGAVRTDCWAEDGVCRVYLDGVRGAREGDTGAFNPSTLLAPFDGVLSCVADEEGGWNIDGPALAYELSNGNLTLRFGALGGAWEEWEDCDVRQVVRGQEIEVWSYTYLEAFVGGEPVSIVSTRDGRLYVGDVALELGCPCEGRR